MKINYKIIITSILFTLISMVYSAQSGYDSPPPPPTPSNRPPPPVGLPIDNGLIYGVAFALFYGAKKIYTKRNA